MNRVSNVIDAAIRRAGGRTRTSRGASLVEYALLIALIALVCFVAVIYLGGATRESFSRTGASVAGS